MFRSVFAAFLFFAFFAFFAIVTSASPTHPTRSGLDIENGKRGTTYSGTGTYYEVGLGACGVKNVDSDFVVALTEANYAGGSHCGKKVQITNPKNGAVETATVEDLCPGCSTDGLDMSPSLFLALTGDLGLGVFQMTWEFI